MLLPKALREEKIAEVALPEQDLCTRNQLRVEEVRWRGREGMNLRMKEEAGCTADSSPPKCFMEYNLQILCLGNHRLNTIAH